MSLYPTFETLSIIDGVVQNIEYHQARFENTMRTFFNKTPDIQLAALIKVPEEYRVGKIRCRIDYNHEAFEVKYFPYTPKEIHTFQCVYVEGLDYRFKYSDRQCLEKLKTENADEVIIINNGFVSDCTIGNLLFLKQNQWYSPTHFLLKGTQLSYLLAQNQVCLTEISVADLSSFEKVMMINALNPFDEKRAISVKQIRL